MSITITIRAASVHVTDATIAIDGHSMHIVEPVFEGIQVRTCSCGFKSNGNLHQMIRDRSLGIHREILSAFSDFYYNRSLIGAFDSLDEAQDDEKRRKAAEKKAVETERLT